ncbi:ATP synthase mitochondrial F1 complex assembly factor 1 isoform X1 [Daphnia magna]|uniref:ATP synthase mitochondrial F1 complex assembly factor 1 isoform X1 n=1 Tax=Daphnia magna TaxID=35525 RepID=UPI001E1BD2B1|nr:ATP synthase mitochondrial F1 complex assembly factor 1 isoform X1 [Daphnia magna]
MLKQKTNSGMALPLIRTIRQNICLYPRWLASSYFTTARIIMNNKSASVDETLSKNPFYEKYASKITTLQQNDPQKLAEKLEQLTTSSKAVSSKLPPSDYSSKFSTAAPSAKQPEGQNSKARFMQSKVKLLSEIMKTELLEDKDFEEIKQIWHEYFKNKITVSGVLTKTIYDELHSRAMQYSTFLFPLPRDEGYEFLLCQFAGNEAHFTSLINFQQTYGENAPECLALVFFPDLSNEKNIVLFRGDYDKNILNAIEAQCLVNQVILYYAQPNERKLKLLERFNKEPETFQHLELVQELETIKLD